jgi:hypothetical protein
MSAAARGVRSCGGYRGTNETRTDGVTPATGWQLRVSVSSGAHLAAADPVGRCSGAGGDVKHGAPSAPQKAGALPARFSF